MNPSDSEKTAGCCHGAPKPAPVAVATSSCCHDKTAETKPKAAPAADHCSHATAHLQPSHADAVTTGATQSCCHGHTSKAAVGPVPAGTQWTCPMHP